MGLSVLWLLSLRSLRLSLLPLNIPLGWSQLLPLKTLDLEWSRLLMLPNLGPLLILRLPLKSLNLSLLSWLLHLGWSRLLMLPNRGPLLILRLPLTSEFLSLLLWSRLIVLDAPSPLPFPMSIITPALPVLLQSLVRNPFVVPPMPVPSMVSVVSSPPGVYIKIETGNSVIVPPVPVIIL